MAVTGGELVPAVRGLSTGGVLRGGSEWELDMSQITIVRRLAVGGFAEVFLGRYQGTLVAVKRLFHDSSGEAHLH
jgi:hypothetical protein